MQRRYGQFTCVACYRFFKEFFMKPEIYTCQSLGKCRLNLKQKCKACWINACRNVYSVDSRRKEILEKYIPMQSLGTNQQTPNSDGQETNGQFDVLNGQFDALNDQSLSNTNNNTPTSLMNDDDEEIEEEDDDANSLEDEEAFPLDFTTKKLLDFQPIDEDKPMNGLKSSADELSNSSGPTDLAGLNASNGLNGISSRIELSNGDNSENQSNNTSSKDQLLNSSNNQSMNKPSNQFATSLHNFMQFNQTSNQDQTDWNNNSLSDSQLTNKLSNGLDKHDYSGINGTNLNELNCLNLSMIHQENGGSPAKKRTKLQKKVEEIC